MNIIKIKDVAKPNDSEFNSKLKGRYAWWIHMRYIVSFMDMSVQQYVSVEEDPSELSEYKYWDSYDSDITSYVDVYETDKANSIIPYLLYNENVIDGDLTIEDIKRFRTWLARTLLTINKSPFVDNENIYRPSYNILDDKTIHMLKYYADGMMDDVLKQLNNFINTSVIINNQYDDCGCNKSSIYGNIEITSCDPITMYKKGLYGCMVDNFSNLDFWMQFKTIDWLFIKFKEYIDAILKKDLLLGDTIHSEISCDCKVIDTQNVNRIKLENLSKSLQYIIEGKEKEHVNFINDSFKDWAENLYEIMQW